MVVAIAVVCTRIEVVRDERPRDHSATEGGHLCRIGAGCCDKGFHRVIQGGASCQRGVGDVLGVAASEVEVAQMEEALLVSDVELGDRVESHNSRHRRITLAHKEANTVAQVPVVCAVVPWRCRAGRDRIGINEHMLMFAGPLLWKQRATSEVYSFRLGMRLFGLTNHKQWYSREEIEGHDAHPLVAGGGEVGKQRDWKQEQHGNRHSEEDASLYENLLIQEHNENYLPQPNCVV